MRSERARKPRPGAAVAVRAVGYLAVLLAPGPARAQWDAGVLSDGGPPFLSAGHSLSAAGEVRPLPPVEPCDDGRRWPSAGTPAGRPYLLENFELDFLARGYFLDDQRIQWTGQETTFGVEGVLVPKFKHRWAGWETTLEGEFYLNQPFDRNILVDTPERASYAANFEVDTFEISKLFLSLRHNDLTLGIGKMETPFGRTYFPLFTNARVDAPFIRTESILWRETGVLVRYEPGGLVADVALTNGTEDRDTNSSKALVTRVGLQRPGWAVGVSLKTQDGIGSESHKRYNDHVGVDFMVRRGPWTVSGEAIYDEYGFRRPGFNPLNITWRRSIYFRDQNFRPYKPITGVGYYVNLGYRAPRWSTWLNYGEFYPQQLGDPRHDVTNRRGSVKFAYSLTPQVTMYTAVMIETEGYLAQANRRRRGTFVLAGFQWAH